MCSQYHMGQTGVIVISCHVYSEEGMKYREHGIPMEEWVLMFKVNYICPFASRGETSFKDITSQE